MMKQHRQDTGSRVAWTESAASDVVSLLRRSPDMTDLAFGVANSDRFGRYSAEVAAGKVARAARFKLRSEVVTTVALETGHVLATTRAKPYVAVLAARIGERTVIQRVIDADVPITAACALTPVTPQPIGLYVPFVPDLVPACDALGRANPQDVEARQAGDDGLFEVWLSSEHWIGGRLPGGGERGDRYLVLTAWRRPERAAHALGRARARWQSLRARRVRALFSAIDRGGT